MTSITSLLYATLKRNPTHGLALKAAMQTTSNSPRLFTPTAYPDQLLPPESLSPKFGNSDTCHVGCEFDWDDAIGRCTLDSLVGGGSKSAGSDNTADETDDNVDCCSDCTCQPECILGVGALAARSIHSCREHSHKNDGGAMNVTALAVYNVGESHCTDSLMFLRRGHVEGTLCQGQELTSD